MPARHGQHLAPVKPGLLDETHIDLVPVLFAATTQESSIPARCRFTTEQRQTSMATLNKEIDIKCSRKFAWGNRDVADHERLVPGFVTDCVLEDGVRTVTFRNGMTIRELIICQ